MASEVLRLVFRGQDETDKAFRSLRSNLNKADSAMGKIKSSLGGVTTAIGVVAGAGGLGLLAKRALESADKLGKMSQTLGTSASELASLQLAANYAGVETDKFNKLMMTFQKRVGEAADGTGQAKATLDKFGISAQYLATLPLDQQLAIIADEFKNLKNPAEQAAAASDLGSNAFIRMIPLLQGGSEGLRQVRDEFKRTGMEIEDNQIDAIEDFNDAMTKLGGIINTAMIKGLSKLAPEMEKFADKAADMAVPLVGDLFKGLDYILNNIDTIVTGIKVFVGAMVATRAVAFAAGIAQITTALVAMAPAATAAAAAFLGPAGLVAAAGAAGYAIGSWINEQTGASDALADFAADVTGLNDKIDDLTKDYKTNARQTGENTKANKGASRETDNLEEAVDNLDKTVKGTERPLEQFEGAVDDIADEEKRAALETDEFREALEKLRKASRTADDDISDFDATIDEYRKTVKNTEATQEDFRDALRNTIGDLTGVDFAVNDLRGEIDKVKKALEAAKAEFGENSYEVRVLEQRLEELGGELVEAVKQTSSLTDAQRDLVNEIKGVNPEVEELKKKLFDAGKALEAGAISAEEFRRYAKSVGDEVDVLLSKDLPGFGDDVDEAFNTRSISDFFNAIANGTGAGGALSTLTGELIGSNGVKSAIGDCFGTKPVTDFDAAVKNLFGGSGSALGGFSVALGGLTSALSDFFAGGELKFSAFKDAIIKTLADIAAAAVASVGINFLKNLIPGLNTGGEVQGFAVGGRVSGPGGPREDKVLARLSPGEYVINAATVSKLGTGFFDQINSGMLPGFALGGLAGGSAPAVLPQLGSVLGFIPGLQAVAGILSLLDELFGFLSGGPSASQFQTANFKLEGSKNRWIGDNVLGAFDGLTEVFGDAMFDYYLPEYGVNPITGIPEIIKSSGVQEVINRIGAGTRLPGGNNQAGYDQNKAIIESMGALSDELAQYIYEYMGQRMLNIQSPSFNMDDVVAKLFNSAQSTAGGSLTLAAREFGGPLERGQASIVGEGGPELFVPGRGGTVSPIARDGGQALIGAVNEVRDEISDLRRQFSRALSGGQLAGGRG